MKASHKWRESQNEKLLFMNLALHNPDHVQTPADHPPKPVNFYCAAPQARSVGLAGEFNHWQPQAMERLPDGWWHFQTELHRGFHPYRLLVDGKPMLDPHAAGADRDEWNEPVSVIVVI